MGLPVVFTEDVKQFMFLLHLPALQAAAKRYRVTGSGKVMARHAGKQHMNEKQTRAKKRELSKEFVVDDADMYKVARCLPYAKLK